LYQSYERSTASGNTFLITSQAFSASVPSLYLYGTMFLFSDLLYGSTGKSGSFALSISFSFMSTFFAVIG